MARALSVTALGTRRLQEDRFAPKSLAQRVAGGLDISEGLAHRTPLESRARRCAPVHQRVRVDSRTLAPIRGSETVISGRGEGEYVGEHKRMAVHQLAPREPPGRICWRDPDVPR